MKSKPKKTDLQTERELWQQLEEMVPDVEAQQLMMELAAAVMTTGDRDRRSLTWPDPPRGEDRGAGMAAGIHDPVVDAETRLAAAEARFRTLVEQIPAVTFMAVLGEGDNEVYVSPHVEQLLGYSQKEWLEDPFLWYWRLHPEDRVLWNDEFARGCRTGGPFRAECRFQARDGSYKWVHGEARIIKDDLDRPLYLQGVAFDITEAKEAQQVLLEAKVHQARIDEELAIARRVQTSILPVRFDVDNLDIAAAMDPADSVGGDYYDVLPAEGGAWIAIGDVSGHGLNSGLVMLMLQGIVSSMTRALPHASPRDILARVNEVLYDNIRNRLGQREHVTFMLARYYRDGRLVFAGAHEYLVVYRKSTGRCETIRTPGTWIGAVRDIRRVTVDTMVRLADGDVVVLYTDGVTEAKNEDGEQFDMDRLMKLTESVADRPVGEIRDNILAVVEKWLDQQLDDISLMVMRYHA